MGDFDQFTVDEIREMVDADDPARMRYQAAAWRRLAKLLGTPTLGQASAVEWQGASAEAFNARLRSTSAVMVSASRAARDNGDTWTRIADEVERARDEVIVVHEEWVQVRDAPAPPPDPRYVPSGVTVLVGDAVDLDTLREPFDREARAIMDGAAAEIAEYGQHLTEPGAEILPDPASGPIGIDPVDSASDTADTPEESILQSTGGWHSTGAGPAPLPGSASGGSAPLLSSAVPQAMAPRTESAAAGSPGVRAPVVAATASPAPVKLPQRRTPSFSRTVRLDSVGRPRLGTVDKRDAPTESQPTNAPVEHAEKQRLSSRESLADSRAVPGVITSREQPEPVFFDPGTVVGGR